MTPNITIQRAASLAVAVSDRDVDGIRKILDPLPAAELRALATYLASAVDIDAPFTPVGVFGDCAEECVRLTAAHFQTTTAAMLSSSRRREHVDARCVAAYAARLCGASFPQIGRAIGKHHTTVMYLVSRAGEHPNLRHVANKVADKIGRGTDDDIVDTPPEVDEEERYDAAVVERILSGVRVDGASNAERAEVIERWQASGRTLGQLARLTGWNTNRIIRQLRDQVA